MKKLILLSFFFLSFAAFSQKKVDLTLEWKFVNLNEGYEHDNKMMVYLDDQLIGESTAKNEKERNSMDFKIPKKGKYKLKIVNYSLYEGNWEIRSVDNDYSTEGTVEIDRKFTKNTKILITFDMDNPEPMVSFQ